MNHYRTIRPDEEFQAGDSIYVSQGGGKPSWQTFSGYEIGIGMQAKVWVEYVPNRTRRPITSGEEALLGL